MKKEKEVLSVRIDAELLEKIKESEIHIPGLVSAAIAKALKENKCPHCGQYTKKANS